MSLFYEEAGSKGRYVQGLFSSIAGSYDFADTLLSFNRDRYWRRFTALRSGLKPGGKALDVATGTGKLALELAREAGDVGEVVGVDFCDEMLSQAQDRLAKTKHHKVALTLASAGALPFPDNTFDCVTIGFGLRNVADIGQTLREMTRVVKAGARVVCLEFSQPENHVVRAVYRPYLFYILPFLGGLISGDRGAYSYLPRSIAGFPRPHEVKQVMEGVGLRDVEIYFLTMGVVAVYVGIKG